MFCRYEMGVRRRERRTERTEQQTSRPCECASKRSTRRAFEELNVYIRAGRITDIADLKLLDLNRGRRASNQQSCAEKPRSSFPKRRPPGAAGRGFHSPRSMINHPRHEKRERRVKMKRKFSVSNRMGTTGRVKVLTRALKQMDCEKKN